MLFQQPKYKHTLCINIISKRQIVREIESVLSPIQKLVYDVNGGNRGGNLLATYEITKFYPFIILKVRRRAIFVIFV